jgi:tetratricopeptide (TPR) repeat protein
MRSTVCSLLAIDLCTLCALCALSALSAVSLSAGDTDIRSLLEGGHWKQARALLEPRVKANPSDAEAAAQLASVREAYGDSDGALQLAERAVKLKPDVAEYHWQLAWVVGNQAQHANVLHQFGLARRFRQEAETTIALDPKHIDARLGMITYYIKAPGILGGDRQKADEMAEEVARIDAASGYLARARVLSDSDTAGDFETLYRQAAEAARTPDVKYDATAALSNWYFAQKPPRYDAAEQQCRALVKIDPHRVGGYRGLAVIYATAARWPELDAVLAESEKGVPDNLASYYRAATIIVLQGNDYARADRYLRKYLTQEPEPNAAAPAYAHWRLGQTLEKEGKRADAIAELEQCAKLKPDLEDARKDLVRLRASR